MDVDSNIAGTIKTKKEGQDDENAVVYGKQKFQSDSKLITRQAIQGTPMLATEQNESGKKTEDEFHLKKKKVSKIMIVQRHTRSGSRQIENKDADYESSSTVSPPR